MSEPTPSLTPVAWEDPDAAALREAQQAELAARYDGVADIEPVLPPDEMVATLLVRIGAEVAGCGSLREAPERGAGVGELKHMYVLPAFRGRGLSRRILLALEEIAAERGLRELVLETGVRQPEAIGLYRSAGYRQIPNYGVYADEPNSVCFAKAVATQDPEV
ncbi:GNAT family N-acetyltransferase [Actinotalea sp.]|uniref:GNAT family N-acetyltransferase n=1 Tax=Actinotalea sp. TaxID=1872145 RepID=UPI0035686D62